MGDARVPGAGYRAHGSSRERHPFDGPRETTRPPRPMATEEHAIRAPGSKHARGIPERPSSFGAFGTLPGRRRRTYFFARFHRAHLFDEDAPQCARIDAPAVQGGVKDSAFSLAFDAFGENPFDFFVTEDSFKATRGTDSLELSKLDAAVLQVNLKDGNEAKELFITRDGLRLTCTLQINATTIPCAVSEFGQTAMLASLGLEEFEVTGTLMRGRSLRGCEVSAFDPEMAGNIVVVSRGGCSFEDKARNAEASGAAAVVVVQGRVLLIGTILKPRNASQTPHANASKTLRRRPARSTTPAPFSSWPTPAGREHRGWRRSWRRLLTPPSLT
jgi:hypothetical protein